MLVLLPESSRKSGHKYWSDSPVKRRHAAEAVLGGSDEHISQPAAPARAGVSQNAPVGLSQLPKTISECFSTADRCMETTLNCSGHGSCGNRYAEGDEHACFACACLATIDDATGSVTHWAGRACQKIDVSGPFWLLAGITILIIGAISMAVGMLFAVGEEKLPGVIGAGVARKS